MKKIVRALSLILFLGIMQQLSYSPADEKLIRNELLLSLS